MFLALFGVAGMLHANTTLTPVVPRSSVKTVCNVQDFGAVGDGHALDTAAINDAIKACSGERGGTVEVPAGTYLTGTIRLSDHITLRLDSGSVLLGSPNLSDYPAIDSSSEGRNTSLIVAENVKDVAIVGDGTIDGNSPAFIETGTVQFDPYFDPSRTYGGNLLRQRMEDAREGPVKMKARPGVLVLMLHADGVTLRDFHVRDAPNWGIKVMCSSHIIVSGLDVRNSLLVPNSDAMDVSDSSDAVISDSMFESGDDALVVGGVCADGWCRDQPTENVTVSNVILQSRSAAIRIGPNAAGARNLVFSNIVIQDSNRGIMVQARDAETIENVLFSNITIDTRLMDGPWWGSGEPITLTVAKWAYPSWDPPSPYTPTSGIGMIRGIRLSHIVVSSTSPVVIYSTEPDRIQNVTVDDLSLTMKASPLQPILGGNLDLQPTTPRSIGLVKQNLSAIMVRNVNDMELDHVRVHWEDHLPTFYRYALDVRDYKGLTIDDFSGTANIQGLTPIRLSRGTRTVVRSLNWKQSQLLRTVSTKKKLP